tara:strand:+ start:4170 stop:4994 length:825 start_codon:yes stop_codon:yes gene_type:complete
MVIYTCPRCGFSNKIKTKIRNHLLRKNPCIPKLKNIDIEVAYKLVLGEDYPCNNSIIQNEQYSCRFCNKIFDRKYNLVRHEASCRDKSHHKKYKHSEYTESEKDIIIASKDRIIEELKNQIELLLRNQGSNNVHNNITYNTSIVLNAFGNENTSYITSEYIKGLINSGPMNSIPKLLQHIHFNPEHQENHNVKIPNKKQSYAEIFNGSTWDIQDRKQTIEVMTDNAYNLLNTHYSGGNEYMNKFKNQYDSNDINLTKRLQKDTEIMILNSQKKI